MPVQRALSIRGESVERIYGFYRSKTFIVNRRYQRKLVWTVEEKESFIDSIARGYPVPLILLAESEREQQKFFEIIDGMQRLNAVASYIEGHFRWKERYFDLDSMASTKEARDAGLLTQNEPKLDRSTCTRIASYQVPLSIYEFDDYGEVDEVFRRVNSFGRQLSRQELRQAGVTGNFPDLVRRIAASIRGDVSASERLTLNDMEQISISSRELPYGLKVESMFWVQQNILTRDYVRQSRDEEIVADLLSYVLLEPKSVSSSEFLDRLYSDPEHSPKSRRNEIEQAVLKYGPEQLEDRFTLVFDGFRLLTAASKKPFNRLMFEGAGVRVPRYFQSVFLALWDLIINQNMEVQDYQHLVKALDGIGGKTLNVGGGGGRWGAEERHRNVRAVVGVLQPYFQAKNRDDPALDLWVTKLENILRQSYTEQNLYDFKQGFHQLNQPHAFDESAFNKCIETLCAMANKGPGSVGYVLVGIADSVSTAQRFREVYGTAPRQMDKFHVVGIDSEAAAYHNDLDRYFQFIVSKIRKQPASPWVVASICRELRLVSYFGHSVLIMKLAAGAEPAHYNDQFKERFGANNEVVPSDKLVALFDRFRGS